MSQLGRISGQLLKENLTRNGHDLAFETDLLYLSVVDPSLPLKVVGVGINTTAPTAELDVNGTTRTVDLEVTTQADIADLTISGETITSNTGILNLVNGAGDQVVYQAKLAVDSITLESNVVSTNAPDTNLEIRPNGTGTVEIYANTNIYGSLTVSGDIQTDGNIIIGNGVGPDLVTFDAQVASDIIPDSDNTRTLGSATNKWKDLWVNNIYADAIDTGEIVVDNINLTSRPGNLLYVGTNGSNSNSGTHQNDPFATIAFALSQASAGDTVYVYPGSYEEVLPLVVPAGVTVKGSSLRSVTVRPTAATMYNDVFLVNGETTVEDITLTGFYHNASTGPAASTGHGFRFAPNAIVTSRSPYIRNVTVLTSGTPSVLAIAGQETQTIDGLDRIKSIIDDIVVNAAITKTPANPENQVINGLIVSDAATGALLQGLIDDVIYIINNGTLRANLPSITANGVSATTGVLHNAAVILENNRNFLKEEITAYVTALHPTPGFVYDIAKCQRDMGYILDAMIYDITRGGNEHTIYAGLAHWVQPANDPRGYDRADAGNGAFIDGSVVNSASKEAAMLFHSATFLTPAAETLMATNGARIEWLNSFTYFASKGMYLFSSPEGFAGDGKTRLKITNKTGTWAVGNTLSYYDTDGITVLASGVIESIDGDFYNIDGRVLGFETPSDRASKTVTVHGDAKLSTAIKKFSTASLSLDGTGDYLSVASAPDFGYGTGDFTIEFWVYRTANAGTQVLFDQRTSASSVTPTIYIGAPDTLSYLVGGVNRISASVPSLTINGWHHIAISRTGTSTKLYANGAQVGSTYTDINNYIQSPVFVGASYVGLGSLTGYMDDVRVSKGLARYTGATYTLPTAQLTGDTTTVLLLTLNGANGSTAIADNGITLQDLRTSAGGTASIIDFANYSDFGVEARSIGSASVYGEYGIYGEGVGVIAYLIGQNLAYIGNGKATTNDPTTVIQANEIVELSDARIFYSSIDHNGDFRIGDLFYVNQHTGEVSFTNSDVTIGTNLTFDDGVGNVTYLDATKIETGDFRISGNTIETISQDFNVDAANNQINLQSNVTITGDLDVTGNVTVGGNVTIGNESTDTVQFVAGVDSDIIPALPSTYDLGTPTERWSTLYSTTLVNDSIQISTNVITTTGSNLDLTLQANGTGRIYVPDNNVEITKNLTVSGITNLATTNIGVIGTPATVTQVGGITQTGDLYQTGNTEITGTLTVGSTVQFEDIQIDNNIITTTIGNNNLQLEAAGTGKIIVPSDNAEVTGTLTVLGTTSTTTINNTGTVTSGTFSTGNITISGNTIQTTVLNSNLQLQAAGTGFIELEQFNVQENELRISTGSDMTIAPNGTGIVNINSTQSIKIPVGDTASRPLVPVAGMIRFNTTLSRYEGYNGTAWIRLDGVEDSDGNTKITAELTPGANDNTIRFYTDGALVADLNSTRLNSINADVGAININNNVISTTTTNTNLVLSPNGTGSVRTGNFAISNNTFINTVNNSITLISQTGDGYVKINSTGGFVIPVGLTEQRPALFEVGMMRYNTTDERVEIWNGTAWVGIAQGAQSGVTAEEATDISILSAIIFG